MADFDSVKKVLVGASLQSVRGIPETGPAKSFIIPASQVVMDAKRAFSLLKAENAQWIIGAVPLGYNVPYSLTIYGYPEKSFFGELMAMAIGPSTVARQNSVGLASYIASVPASPTLPADLVAGGAYTGVVAAKYTVKIAVKSTPDTYVFKKDSGAYSTPAVNIVAGTPIALGDGVTATFTTATGHTADDVWEIKVFNSLAYRHTFLPADIPPAATFWQQERAGELKAGDVVCNKLAMKIANNKEMQATADLIGGSIAIVSDMGTPVAADYPDAEDSDKIFRSGLFTLNYGQSGAAVRTNMRDINISIDRGINPDEGRTQDKVSNANMYTEKNELQLELEFLLTSLEELQRSWDGITSTAPSATSPDWTATLLPACNLLQRTPAKISTSIDSAVPAVANTSPNDLTTAGTFTGAEDATYTITIQTAAATDKFTVTKDGGTPGAPIDMLIATPQAIGDGITVSFASKTAHVIANTWTIQAKVHYYELELDIEHASVQFTAGQSGGRRTGKLVLTPIANPAAVPYRMYITNLHSTPYA
jgi:hypothetical protein